MTAPTPEDIKAQYGFVAMLAQKVPEIGGLMEQAVREKWTADRFNMAVANTGWWKNTPREKRQWITQQIADPASATRDQRTGGEQVIQLAAQLGFYGVKEPKARDLWLNAKLAGYDATLTRGYIFQQLVGTAGPEVGGQYGQVLNSLRELSGQYGYQPTEEELRTAAHPLMMASGEVGNIAGWESKMKNYAQGKYAPFADRIAAGETVQDIARPYIDVYAQTLEVNPQDVGLSDQYVQRWLQGRSEAGKPPAATAVWQAAQELRKDSRWGYTNNARRAAADVATTIGKSFGMIG